MKKHAFWLTLAASLALTACTTILSNLPGVYKLDIDQGNIIDQRLVDQLRPNMTKRQVLYILGSPMLNDTFHDKRWDYVYSSQPGGGERMQKRLTLYFNNDNLVAVQGDFHPSAMPVAFDKTAGETSIDLPKRELDKSMWEKLTGLTGDDDGNSGKDVQTQKSSRGGRGQR